MKIETHPKHPTFSKWFQRFFLSAWIVTAALFGGGYLLLKHGFEIMGRTLAISFCFSIIGTMIFLGYQLFNVKCPTCGLKTRTAKDPTQSCWMAHCKSCNKIWDLGIGAG